MFPISFICYSNFEKSLDRSSITASIVFFESLYLLVFTIIIPNLSIFKSKSEIVTLGVSLLVLIFLIKYLIPP